MNLLQVQSTVSMMYRDMTDILTNPEATADPTASNSLSYIFSKVSELDNLLHIPNPIQSKESTSPYSPFPPPYCHSSASSPQSSPPSDFITSSDHIPSFDASQVSTTQGESDSDSSKKRKMDWEKNTKTKTIVALRAFSNICSKQLFVEENQERIEARKKEFVGLDQGRRQRKTRRARAKQEPSTQRLQCKSCGETETCEWRRGPDGYKSLCNACGIHFAKMVKREEANASTYVPKSVNLQNLLNG
eukprot:TRINITY_DN11663_c0_g1_i1.p1 TRINITY_DN11663_c0_g1~~TRINITY_DN11663_c0_g1_i1.p1  ORF type:complete len:246 (-),score=43.18 TRINITY_DN11663_c0_g1_i1:48-785(-)